MTVAFGQCRAAAAAAYRAEFGLAARGAARPRGVFGVVRERGPVAVQLWVAEREGRLEWQQQGPAFALIEPPAAERDPLTVGGVRLTAARMVDRHWELVAFAGPAAGLLLLAVVLALIPPIRLAGLVAALLALIWVAVLMTCFVVRAVVGVFRSGPRGRDPDRLAVQLLSGTDWHVSLCHQPVEDRCAELLGRASIRATRRIAERGRRAAGDHGVRTENVQVTRDLAWLLSGATTGPMRDAITAAVGTAQPRDTGSEVVIVTRPGRRPEPKRLPFDNGSFVFWYFAGVAAVTAVLAGFVAGRERDACAADCAGRPASYGSAVRWLLSNLVFADGGLHPISAVWAYGLLYRVLGLVSLAVVVAAAYRFVRWQQARAERLSGSGERMPAVLIVVAKQLERDAVVAAVTAVNGSTPRPDHSTEDSVVHLGEVGGVEVMVATATGQGTADPNGALFTALATGRFFRPRYLILCGICYGLDDERQAIGDVLVSQRVIDIDHRAELEDRVVIRGVNVPPSRRLLSRLQDTTLFALPYQVHFGPMVSSARLLDSTSGRAQLKHEIPQALGGDMEAAAVYAAAATNGIEWIVVKGISDRGKEKSYDPQRTAAANAADFVVRTLRAGGLVDTTETVRPGER